MKSRRPDRLLVFVGVMAGVAAHAQELDPRVPAVPSASAPQPEPKRTVFIEPSISVQETATTNARQTSEHRSDLITEVRPEIRVSSLSGRVRGFVDYTLVGLVYARGTVSNNIQHLLNAAGTAEAIENRLFVDASASISNQYVSALGTRSTNSEDVQANRTRVASARLAPHVRGELGGLADYEARAGVSATRSAETNADSTTTDALLRLGSSPGRRGRLGWSGEYSHQTVDFGDRGSQHSDRLLGSLGVAATQELQLSARAGYERNDLATLDTKGYASWGASLAWTPSERTRLDAVLEHRYFGPAHSVRFEHRTPRTVWTFTDLRDVSTDASSNGSGAPTTVFDLLFTQFASIAPDPVQRAALVDAFLRNNGLTRSTLLRGGLLTPSSTIHGNQNFSLAFLGLRSTLLVSAYRDTTKVLDPAGVVTGDLANGSTLRQNGIAVNVSHRLTPLSALSVDLSQTRASSAELGLATTLRSMTATLSSRLQERVDFSISVRRSLFESTTNPYNESALLANLRWRL